MSWNRSDIPDQTGRIAVVTGANGGLGLEAAEALAAAGAHVIMAARSPTKTEAAVARIRAAVPDAALEVVPLDLASQGSVRAASDMITAGHDRIDLLMNNAGVMAIPQSRTDDGFETQLAVNHLGHFALTGLLLPSLLNAPAPRVVTVTSTAHHFGRRIDPSNPNLEGSYSPFGAYGQSKLANFHFGLGLQRRFEDAKVYASSLLAHPGLTRTDLQTLSVTASDGGSTQRFWEWVSRTTGMTPAQGALSQLRAATDPQARGGDFFGPAWVNAGPPVRKPVLRRYRLDDAVDTLWAFSEKATGVTFQM
ncbi:MAG: SDR family NAD(P)-dependent oxidoreductase [Actinomycetia bacterium]|nr:SDR family NAD(P)-dependent oxidoreductase [Actinomycetes bacterium]